MNRMTEYTNKEKGFALPASLPDNDLGDTYSLEDICCKLAPFEDAEEQDRLIILPCKIGGVVYYFDEMKCPECPKRKDESCDEENYLTCNEIKIREGIFCFDDICEIGKTVFLTREEAEATLKANL